MNQMASLGKNKWTRADGDIELKDWNLKHKQNKNLQESENSPQKT